MDLLPRNISYTDGACWLVKLRWLFIIWLAGATFIAKNIFVIDIEDTAFYNISLALLLENFLSLFFIKKVKNLNEKNISRIIRIIINFQISTDLLFLILIIHFSGGIENPIYIFCVFHMVISSILLPRIYSYIQTAYAVILLWTLAYLEYSGLINHYDLWLNRSLKGHLFNDIYYIVESLTIFTLTSFMLVYMANYIVGLLRKQERAYHKANMLLEQQGKIKDEYILRVTHNIKGHLTVIQANLSLIIDKMLGDVQPKQLEFIDIAHTRTVKLTGFVNELLNITQMRLSDNVEIKKFSISNLALNVFGLLKKNAEDKKIDFTYYFDERIDEITSNPLPIEEIILNLLHNAIKYTPENGKVKLILKDNKDTVSIIVTDTGIGIPKEEIPKLFNEFFRASNAKKIIKDGNGLGLALVKYIAKRYGGDVSVRSEENKGSEFTVVLPKIFREKKKK